MHAPSVWLHNLIQKSKNRSRSGRDETDQSMVNETEFAATFASNLAESYGDRLMEGLRELGDKAKAHLRAGLKKYATSNKRRYGKTKTFLYRDKPVPLEKFYVPAFVKHKNKDYSDFAFVDAIWSHNHIGVLGTAGSGKSIFMRYLFLKLLGDKDKRFPVLIELRDLNDSGLSIMESVHKQISSCLTHLSRDLVDNLFAEGAIVLLLDGYDEVNYDRRREIGGEISRLCQSYPDSHVVVTSRPDDAIEAWETFSVFRVMPLKKQQTIELLNKLDYTQEVKSKFIEEVEVHLFEAHKDFLSNPMLTTMMLLTYEQFAEVPTKIHLFYQQAFMTLFVRHDSYKGVWKRKRYANLALDDFERMFSHFCAATYFREKFNFDDAEVRNFISDAMTAYALKKPVEDVLKDLTESVCLLQPDGLKYTFVHRSFQEYFTSLFVLALPVEEVKDALDSVVRRLRSDSVLSMAYGKRPDLIEKGWIIPMLQEMCDTVASIDAEQDTKEFYDNFFGSISVKPQSITFSMRDEDPLGWGLMAIRKLYGEDVNPYLNLDVSAYREKFQKSVEDDQSLRNDVEMVFGSERTARFLAGSAKHLGTADIRDLTPAMFTAMGLRERAVYEKDALFTLLSRVKAELDAREASHRGVFRVRGST